jgi:hypothetical protein
MDTARIISLAGLTMIFFWIYLSIRRNRGLPRRHAAERLFAAFKDEVQDLANGKGDAYEILKQALPRHESAYLHFRPHLNGKVLREFDHAWRDYSCGVQGQSSSFPKENSAPGNEAGVEESRKTGAEEDPGSSPWQENIPIFPHVKSGEFIPLSVYLILL